MKADNPVAPLALAESLLGAKRLAEAERAIRPVVDQSPDLSRAVLLLGQILLLQCRHTEALALLDDYTQRQADDCTVWQLFAQTLADKGEFDRSAAAYERFLDYKRQDVVAWLDYAIALRFAGRRFEAEKALRQGIEIDPSYGALWWTLCNMAPDAISAEDRARMQETLARAEYVDDASQLHVAIATMMDRNGDYAQAIEHFVTGKGLRARVSAYRPSDLTEYVERSITAYPAELLETRGGWGAGSQAPIFIVGMPRSGSTLVERVLGRHSQIEPAGELPIIPRLIDELDAEAGGPGQHIRLVTEASRERIKELGELYLRRSKEFRRTGKPFFTDKLHMNWRNLGLIKLILPNARIIDVRRNAIECCWSNFRTLFASGHPASDNLGWIGHFYREYVRLAEHMARLAEGRQLTVRYEDVVDGLEAEARRLFSFVGLQFEPDSLDFHLLDDPVATASAEQVRRPLNREGIGRAEPYRQWLGPLIESLGPLAAES